VRPPLTDLNGNEIAEVAALVARLPGIALATEKRPRNEG
jgi:hypothetical protein